jgi:hypothetical protein
MPSKSIAPKQSLTEPLAGAHHCIGSGHAIVDLTFRFLHASCASHGGSLTDTDLTAAHADLIDSFSSSSDYFELVHKRCMVASGATAPMMFGQGKMLSSLLFVCSQRIAAHCFSLQFDRLGNDWLNLFFGAFSESIRHHVCIDAEARLVSAYGRAAGKLRQKFTIKKLLSEQDVQNVLRDCILPFKNPETCGAMATEMNDEVNHWIGKQSGTVCPHVSKITNEQMHKFLSLFPSEAIMVLTLATPIKSNESISRGVTSISRSDENEALRCPGI